MDWIGVDLQIACMLLAWILAVYGYGGIFIKILQLCAKSLKLDFTFTNIIDTKFAILLKGFLGVIFLCFIVQILNFFIPINSLVSIIFCVFGIGLFVYFFKRNRDYFCHRISIFAFIIAFLLSALFACISDIGAYDTGLYHLQATKWIEQSPIVFGIANIHTRFGFNNILYNFDALSEVSHIFSPRSFIANDIMMFYFFSFCLVAICNLARKNLSDIFASIALVFAIIAFPQTNALYADGIVGLIGLSIVCYIIFLFERQIRSHFAFLLLFVLAFFAIYIKVSALFLLVCVAFVYWQMFGLSKDSSKKIIGMGVLSGILGVFWALKGICVSGMIAYPSSFLHIQSLPYSISEATRSAEVASISDWAKTYGNSEELNGGWVKVWLKHHFTGIAYSLILFIGGGYMAIFSVLILSKRMALNILAPYKWLLLALIFGIIFWFVSAPDLRFGYGYFFPIFSLFGALCMQYIFSSKTYTIHPNIFFVCGLIGVCVIGILLVYFDKKGMIIHSLKGVTYPIKTHHYELQSKITQNGLLLYFPTKGDQVGDAPLPAAPSFVPNLAKGTFLGRDMYYRKENK